MSVLSKITFEDLDAASCSEPLKYQIADLIAERDQLREQFNKVVWDPQKESDSGFYHAMPVERLTEIHNKMDQLRTELAEIKEQLKWAQRDAQDMKALAASSEEGRLRIEEHWRSACIAGEELKEENERFRDGLEFCEMTIGHAIELGYVGEGSTLGMFNDALEKCKAIIGGKEG